MGFPKFEGQAVAAARLKLNGFGEDLAEALKLGETVYYIVEARVDDVQHPNKNGIITRTHKGMLMRQCRIDPAVGRKELDAADQARQLAELDEDRRTKPGLPGVKDELDMKRRAAGEKEND